MNKFQANITKSNKSIKETRAKRIADQAKMAQETLVRELIMEKMGLEAKLEDLEDLSPDSAMSLNPIKGEFKAELWVKDLQNTKVLLLNKSIELNIADKTTKEYFSDEKK